MNSKIFIDRPIFAAVLSVAIVILGIIGLTQLPVEQFPEIAPPTVSVSTNYPGANAETVMKSVIVPLEEAINGVENMIYMTSSATNSGNAFIQIYFKQGTDGDIAMVNVQNRIASAQGLLPGEVTKGGVSVRKRQTSRIKTIALYSPDDSYDERFINNYMKINIEPRLSRVAGVGEVDVRGADYSMRIWLDPIKMASYGLVPADISKVLDEQNVEKATGTLGADSDNEFRYVLKYRGRYENSEDFENMVIRSNPDGTLLRLRDVADVELGQRGYDYVGMVNGHPGTVASISQTSGSNANKIIEEVDEVMKEISETLPRGLKLVDLMSTKDFLDASIDNVVSTLLEAIVLVILVVYVFLQSFKATVIPAIGIVVSLVGTFAFLHVAGFSINMITLFALVLVIGTVVDDAIVVVEAVQARFDAGERSPYKATVGAMKDIAMALVTTTFVFMAVFIPVSFMGGTTGVFYKQFGLTMAVAVGISMINALTLSPALCALILTPHGSKKNGKRSFSTRFHNGFDRFFVRINRGYLRGVAWMFRHAWLTGCLIVIAGGALYWLIVNTKTGLVPSEDMSSINIDVQMPPATNLASTKAMMDRIDSLVRDIPQIEIYSRTTGFGMISGQSVTAGTFDIRLKNWSERTKKGDDIESVIAEIYRRTEKIKSAKIQVFTRGMIPGYGLTNGFELYVQDHNGGDIEDLKNVTFRLIEKLSERPEISRATTSFDTKYPQYLIEVDAAMCKRNGVSPSDVLDVMAGYIGGSYASNFNRFSKLYRVMVQASPQFRLDTNSLDALKVRTASGEMSPLSQYITVTRVFGTESLSRFNLFPAIRVNGTPAPGYSSGDALKAVKEVTAEVLPLGYGYEYGGIAREEATAGGGAAKIFVICVVFIYLILCALYESLFIPVAIIVSVPFGLAGSLLFANLSGLENNIYLQVGLLMLIGLLAKTAILLTEYASKRRREGMSIVGAAMSAARMRLRPIMMTSLTMVFGMLPMAFAHGVGANGNRSIGIGTCAGMVVGILALLYLVPVLFAALQWVQEKLMPKRVRK